MSCILLIGNVVAVWGARLVRVDYVLAFLIMLQIEIVEMFVEWFGSGEMLGWLTMFELEYSMLMVVVVVVVIGALVDQFDIEMVGFVECFVFFEVQYL